MDDVSRRASVYERLLDCMPDAAGAIDVDGVFFFVNRRACELTGYSAQELIGSSCQQLLDPADRDAVTARVSATIRVGTPVSRLKTRVRRKDGETVIVSIDVHPLIDAGRIVGAVGTAEDWTAREHAERQYRLFESVVLNAREGIVVTEAQPIDPPGPRIRFVNQAFARMTGYEADELLGQTPRLLQGSRTDRAVLDEIRSALALQSPVQVELVNYRKDQSEYWSNLSILSVPDTQGQPSYLVGFHVDVTDRRRREITLERKIAEAERQVEEGPLADLFPGREPATKYLRQQILRAAPSRRLPVLILGERGTGKALVAREIHRLSPRTARPFLQVDCTAIPATLFESEMFGHERGAFTGAATTKHGLFQQADGGTLFLDEIGELSLEQQAKLLTAIQERCIRRVGGTTAIPVDVRIMAATNRDLHQMLAEGRFRYDLYDRILGFPIEVPRLRDRGADLDLYVHRFVARWADDEGKVIVDVDPGVLDAFHRYPWPGNVRELEYVIARMVAQSQDEDERLTVDQLPVEISHWQPPDPGTSAQGRIEGVERRISRRDYSRAEIEGALERNDWIIRRAASELGIARNTLYRLMDKYGIKPRLSRP